jgi:hypothetical protein
MNIGASPMPTSSVSHTSRSLDPGISQLDISHHVTVRARPGPVGPHGCDPVTATGNRDNKEIRSMSGPMSERAPDITVEADRRAESATVLPHDHPSHHDGESESPWHRRSLVVTVTGTVTVTVYQQCATETHENLHTCFIESSYPAVITSFPPAGGPQVN